MLTVEREEKLFVVLKMDESGQESLKYLIYTKRIVFTAKCNPEIHSVVHVTPVINGPQRVKLLTSNGRPN